MTPRCCVCGQFTTHAMERFMASSTPYSEDDRWFCSNHVPARLAA